MNNKIPKGHYCYDEKGTCPYWSSKDDLPEQENGHCSFLNKSDYELNEERGEMKWFNQKGEVSQITRPHEIPSSLLWDMVKECGENIERE